MSSSSSSSSGENDDRPVIYFCRICELEISPEERDEHRQFHKDESQRRKNFGNRKKWLKRTEADKDWKEDEEKRQARFEAQCPKTLRTVAAGLGLKTMSGLTHATPLPPLEGTKLVDLDTSTFLVTCPSCPAKKNQFPLSLFNIHAAWHARTNLVIRLRTALLKDLGSRLLQPTRYPYTGGGTLVRISYKNEKGKVLREDVGRRAVTEMIHYTEPFVEFRYIEGLMYTFGPTFLGRRTQGEFIYCNIEEGIDDYETDSDDDDDEPENSRCQSDADADGATAGGPTKDSYFTLTCRDSCMYISRPEEICSLTVVLSVNGVPLTVSDAEEEGRDSLSSMRGRKLHFGDVLSISAASMGRESRFLDFLFKPSVWTTQSKLQRSDDAESSASNVIMDNPLVLQTVLEFLPTNGLQALRLISHLWNREALKVLRPRVRVSVFKARRGGKKDSMQIYNYAKSQMNALGFPHWGFNVKEDWAKFTDGQEQEDASASRAKIMTYRKMHEDFLWFFNPQVHSHNVKSLQLSQFIITPTSVGMLETVLDSMRRTLTSLDLRLHFPVPTTLCPPSSLKDLTALQSLSLTLDNCIWRYVSSSYKDFLKGFLFSVGNIRNLTLTNERKETELGVPNPFTGFVLNHVASIQDSVTFSHLTQVSLACGSGLGSLASLRQGSLRKVELMRLNPEEPTQPLFHALHMHSQSLEEVALGYEAKVAVSLKMHFPWRLSRLRNLSVFFCVEGRKIKFREVGFLFGGADGVVTSMDAPNHFPSLQSLTVWPVISTLFWRVKRSEGTDWGISLPVLKAFIQPGADEEDRRPVPVASVQSLDIPFLLGDLYHPVLDTLEASFPNVDFPPELALARARPVWLPVGPRARCSRRGRGRGRPRRPR